MAERTYKEVMTYRERLAMMLNRLCESDKMTDTEKTDFSTLTAQLDALYRHMWENGRI